MKERTKPKGFRIAAILAALLISAAIVPAMGTHEDGEDDRIDKLVHDLENAVTSYNGDFLLFSDNSQYKSV